MKEKFERPAFSWILALLLPVFAVFPALFQPIEEHAYDAAVSHVYRGVVFSAARSEGQFYPRWAQGINAGLGGPLFSFYSPMAYFLMDALHSTGLAHPVAWRVSVALALVAASAGAFGLGLALFKRADIALVGAACFTYTHYLLQEFFERGSTQGMAVALIPCAFWSLLLLAKRPSGLGLLWASLCWAIMTLFHTGTTLIVLPALGVFLVYLAIRSGVQRLRAPLLALLAGSLLTAFHIIPAVLELQYVQIENVTRAGYARPAENPLRLAELLSLPPVFDTRLGTNAMGQRIGPLHALALLLGPALALALYRSGRIPQAILAGGFTALGLAILWLMSEAGTPVWRAVAALDLLQFRWRLLSDFGLVAAVIVGSGLELALPPLRRVLVIALTAVFIGLQLPSLYPQLLHHYARLPRAPTVADAQAFALSAGLPGLTTFDEFLPRWRTLPFTQEEAQKVTESPFANLPPGGRILRVDREAARLRIELESALPFRASVHVLYFPGWAGYVDGQRQMLAPAPQTGYLSLDVPGGTHLLELRYEGTPIQHTGAVLSGLTALALIAAAILYPFREPAAKAEFRSAPVYLEPYWWLPAGLLLLAVLKVVWIDPHTTLFRRSSTCQSVHGAGVHTEVLFGENIRLCGYRLGDTVFAEGDKLRVVFYWEARQPASESLNTFVHLLGQTAHLERAPLAGSLNKETPGGFPVRVWEAGKLYEDVYEFEIGTPPPGEYQLEIGWWEPATGLRLMPAITKPSPQLSVSLYESLLLRGLVIR